MKKIVIAGIGIIFVVLIIALIVLYPSAMRDIEPRGIGTSIPADGSYTGTFEQGRFTNTLTVHIADSRIVGINIVDDVFAGGIMDISAEVFNRVIAMQNTRIDAVTGATITTNAYLKAIENALSGQ